MDLSSAGIERQVAALPQEKRDEARQRLIALSKAAQANPLVIARPNSRKQHLFLASKRNTKVYAGANGAGKCLHPDTLVRMADGSERRIADIKSGEYVVGVGLNGETAPAKVTELIANGTRELYRFTVGKFNRTWEVCCSPDHKVLAKRHGRTVITPITTTDDKYANVCLHAGFDLPRADGEEWAFILGALLGAGRLQNKSITFTTSDPAFLTRMEEECALFGLHLTNQPSSHTDHAVTSNDKAALKRFRDWFDRMCVGTPTAAKTLPDECLSWSNRALSQLIAAYFMADGSAHYGNTNFTIAFSSASRALLEQVEWVLSHRFGIYGAEVTTRTNKWHCSDLTYSNHGALDRFNDLIPLAGKKRETLRTALAFWTGRQSDGRNVLYRSAEPLGQVESYDLSIDNDTHLFALANGMVVSNSHIGTVDDLIQLCDASILPEHLRQYKRWEPPFRLRIVVPKFNLIDGATLEKFRQLTPKDQLQGGDFAKAFDKQNRRLNFANGSWVVFNSADQDVNAHSAIELDRVRFDEEPEGEHGRKIYNENLARLRSANPRQVVFTFTPQNDFTWTHDILFDKRENEIEPGVWDDDNMLFVQVPMSDNPAVYTEEYDAELKRTLPPEEYAARVEGKFVSFRGLVLKHFRETATDDGPAHLVDPPSRAHVKGLDTYVIIDPGISQAAVLWCGVDRDNHILVYDELYPRDAEVTTLAKLIKEKNSEWDAKPLMYLIDPSSRNRNLATGETVEDLFIREDIPVVKAKNDRKASILELRARLKANAWLVSTDCVNWLRERRRWVVAKDENTERERSGNPDTFATLGPDHLMDCSRMMALERMWYPEHTTDTTPRWNGPGTAPPAEYYDSASNWDKHNDFF